MGKVAWCLSSGRDRRSVPVASRSLCSVLTEEAPRFRTFQQLAMKKTTVTDTDTTAKTEFKQSRDGGWL